MQYIVASSRNSSQFVVDLVSNLYATIPWRVSDIVSGVTVGGFFSGRYRPDKPVTEGRFSKDTWLDAVLSR